MPRDRCSLQTLFGEVVSKAILHAWVSLAERGWGAVRRQLHRGAVRAQRKPASLTGLEGAHTEAGSRNRSGDLGAH